MTYFYIFPSIHALVTFQYIVLSFLDLFYDFYINKTKIIIFIQIIHVLEVTSVHSFKEQICLYKVYFYKYCICDNKYLKHFIKKEVGRLKYNWLLDKLLIIAEQTSDKAELTLIQFRKQHAKIFLACHNENICLTFGFVCIYTFGSIIMLK